MQYFKLKEQFLVISLKKKKKKKKNSHSEQCYIDFTFQYNRLQGRLTGNLLKITCRFLVNLVAVN